MLFIVVFVLNSRCIPARTQWILLFLSILQSRNYSEQSNTQFHLSFMSRFHHQSLKMNHVDFTQTLCTFSPWKETDSCCKSTPFGCGKLPALHPSARLQLDAPAGLLSDLSCSTHRKKGRSPARSLWPLASDSPAPASPQGPWPPGSDNSKTLARLWFFAAIPPSLRSVGGGLGCFSVVPLEEQTEDSVSPDCAALTLF